MKSHTIPALALAAALLGTAPFALAESDDNDNDDMPMMQTMPQMQGMPMMQGMGPMGMKGHHGRGMGMGMMGGMSGGMMRGGPGMMTMLFTMIDANGDDALQLEEMQAVQQRFFNRMDADDNGAVSLEEMQAFAKMIHGG